MRKGLIFILFISLFLSSDRICYAATPQEEYKKIQKEIDTHRKKLKDTKSHESSILSDIEITNKQLKKVDSDLRKYKKRLISVEATLSKIEAEIFQNRTEIEKYGEWIKRKIRAIYKYGNNSDVALLLFGTDDLTQMLRTGRYLQYITVYEYDLLRRYKENIKGLNEKEKQLMTLKSELVKNREKIRHEETSLAEKKKEKEMLLVSVRKEQSSYRRMLRELKETSTKLLEIIRKSEREDNGIPFSAKGFSGLKGRLPWPVDGKVAIPYGSQKDPQFNTPIFRSGAYIQSDRDSYARSVHDGKVVFADWFKGYGQLIIVNHGEGYHTLYGSLSEIFIKVGDIIKVEQTIGRIGNTGILNSPSLYFELRYKGKPLNPIQWLKRK